MIRHTITGLVIDCIEAITEHCQFSFPVFMRLYTCKYSMSTHKNYYLQEKHHRLIMQYGGEILMESFRCNTEPGRARVRSTCLWYLPVGYRVYRAVSLRHRGTQQSRRRTYRRIDGG